MGAPQDAACWVTREEELRTTLGFDKEAEKRVKVRASERKTDETQVRGKIFSRQSKNKTPQHHVRKRK